MRSSALVIAPPQPPAVSREGVFQQSALKLYRARQHAHDVSNMWEAGVKRHFAAATGKKVDLSYDVWEFLTCPPVFVEISLSIGDCIRNLRSAVDYLVSEMARSAGLPDSQTIFPFASNLSNLKSSFNEPVAGDKHRKGRRAGALYDLSRQYPDLERTVTETVEPYSGAEGAGPLGDTLWRIITSDNVDKHRLMAPTVQQTEAKLISFTNNSRIIGARLFGIPFRPDRGHYLKEESDFAVDIVFSEPVGLAGKPVTSTLMRGCDVVGDVIEIFRNQFAAEMLVFRRTPA